MYSPGTVGNSLIGKTMNAAHSSQYREKCTTKKKSITNEESNQPKNYQNAFQAVSNFEHAHKVTENVLGHELTTNPKLYEYAVNTLEPEVLNQSSIQREVKR